MAAWFPACLVVVALAVLFPAPAVSEWRPFVPRRPEDCPPLGTGPLKLFGNCTTELTQKEGGTASLLCPLAADLSRSTFRASKDQSKNIVHVRTNGHDNLNDQNKTFQGRTSLSDEAWERGTAELNISSLEPDDTGIYEFYLDGKFKCQFVLTVAKSQEPSEAGKAPTSAPTPSETPPATTPSDDQPTDNTGIYAGIGIVAAVAAAAIGLGLYFRCCRNTDTNTSRGGVLQIPYPCPS